MKDKTVSSLPERRKARRVNAEVMVECHRHNGVEYTLSKDISPGGLKLVSNYFSPIAAKLILQVSFKRDIEPLRTLGEIIWVEKLPFCERYNLGIEFKHLDDPTRCSIHNFISEYSSV